ncbi:hypothetical protein EWM64_g2946 [Hericium alpestre]|uniref:G-protein coupled receptors family 1 profile domain-containing protein n=1 Tax=Hericium alpestre TaxID=135208 RepID=A0A4Z0A412_9AGAM|nr:hypothetical protein EWM64_g2946 [Hericium alpestre]
MASTEIVLERSFYIGIVIGGMLYGLELYICFQSIYYLFTRRTSHRTHTRFYVAYGVVMLLLFTISLAVNALLGQLMWIDHRDVPGGPAAYLEENLASWWQTFGTTASVATNILGDGLLLYRCYMVWGSRLWIVAFPIMIYLGSIIMSIFTIIESVAPGSSIFKGDTINYEIPFISLSVSLNIIVTLLISSRLLMMRRQISKLMAPDLANTYTNIIAILVESAAPFTIFGILLVIFLARSSPVEYGIIQLWGTFCVISPQLIILRVAMGEAWSRETVSRFSGTPVFATNISSTVNGTQSQIAKSADRSTDSEKGKDRERDLSGSSSTLDQASPV